ncbi:hypothetical protein KOAAANKH_00113 [Brevundimonas sp. NIBR10]|uniref:hypothetical protein n=1 Tax=Brevundimonas sp. NIBR10 TaxID=3015997 RepID=UPI0022F153BF|nr:hypothetical protein [Brevundimonas sp. NIBR10]WGM45252.1 hypothetical protein KOAAANKH_00113 [Brevundimonas sp. NIBR10]
MKGASRKLCADWGCPAKLACARHHIRSLDYWRFDLEASAREGVAFMKRRRQDGEDSCNRFENDVPRAWLLEAGISTIPATGADGGWAWLA